MTTRTRFASASLVSVLLIAAGCSSSTEGATTDGGTDGASAPVGFQPSNITVADIMSAVAAAQAEDVTGGCEVDTDKTNPDTDCFNSPIHTVKQPDGTQVNLVVVKSLTVEKAATITAEGDVPFVLVSLADITLSGSIDAHSSLLDVGAGGTPGAASDAKGGGAGGGAAGSGTKLVGGSGGSYCGVGGQGGGQSATGSSVGSIDIRPLVGGSSGGGGDVGSGSGGGAIQLVANGSLTIKASSSITVGGASGTISGVSSVNDQNSGGGGSGGSILLEATSIDVAGTLAANGGGGGGSYSGAAANDATPNATPAAGGKADTSGAAGGAGGAGSTAKGSPGQAGKGLNSGGGGGGAGRIRMNSVSGSASMTGTISPAESTFCAIVAKVRTFSDGP